MEMKCSLYKTAFLLSTICVLLVSGCSSSHRRDSDYVFRKDAQELMVDMGQYRSVQDREGQDADVALAVAISGGGYRAANFAAGVLCGLEQLDFMGIRRNLLREVDYFSTVSGGGFTVGLYMAETHKHASDGDADQQYSFCSDLCSEKGVRVNLRDSIIFEYLKSLGKTTLSLNAYKLITNNRTKFLEQNFEDIFLDHINNKDRKSLVMKDVFVPSGAVERPRYPYWFQNSTVFDNGAIFPHSPDIYKAYGVKGYTHRLERIEVDSDDGYYDIPLSLGMTSSAAYPPVMSPVTLETLGRDKNNSYLYLIDGGLSDFLGVITALRVLEQEKAGNRVLVVIDAGFMDREPFSKGPWGPHFLDLSRRTMGISIDSWRARYKDFAMKYAKGAGMGDLRVISLDFMGLTSECKNDIKDIVARFNINRGEQDALLRAGMESVRLKTGELYCAFNPKGTDCLETASPNEMESGQISRNPDMCEASGTP